MKPQGVRTIMLASITALVISASLVSASSLQNVIFNAEIPDLMSLSWAPSYVGSSIQLTGPNRIGEYQYKLGYIDRVDGGKLVVSSVNNWDLFVVADANNFSGGSGIKPSSDIFIDLDLLETYPYIVDGINPVLLMENHKPGIQLHDILYKITFSPQDTPGVYSINLTYTLAKH